MNDRPLIIIGLVIALAILAAPFWYPLAAGRSDPAPSFTLPKGTCVEKNMRVRHMDLLEMWRDEVVRKEKRMYDSEDYPQARYEMSLTKTCLLQCHATTNREGAPVEADMQATVQHRFCQQCHDYADVHPNCWNCHLEGSQR